VLGDRDADLVFSRQSFYWVCAYSRGGDWIAKVEAADILG